MVPTAIVRVRNSFVAAGGVTVVLDQGLAADVFLVDRPAGFAVVGLDCALCVVHNIIIPNLESAERGWSFVAVVLKQKFFFLILDWHSVPAWVTEVVNRSVRVTYAWNRLWQLPVVVDHRGSAVVAVVRDDVVGVVHIIIIPNLETARRPVEGGCGCGVGRVAGLRGGGVFRVSGLRSSDVGGHVGNDSGLGLD